MVQRTFGNSRQSTETVNLKLLISGSKVRVLSKYAPGPSSAFPSFGCRASLMYERSVAVVVTKRPSTVRIHVSSEQHFRMS
jgi:hypothetical protein